MNAFSKILTLAMFGAGIVMIGPTSSLAQTAREAAAARPIDPMPMPAQCCSPAQRTVVTNASWTVTVPTGSNNPYQSTSRTAANPPPASLAQPQAAVPLTSWPYYHAPFPGSQWIGPTATSGVNSQNSGSYVYAYHFCLCSVPPHVPFPASMSLNVYSDNNFSAKLNNHPIGNNNSQNPNTTFQIPSYVSVPTSLNPVSYFQAGDNELDIIVSNISGPTGLDVSGTISGYFQQIPAGGKCPHYPSIPPYESPR